MQCAGNYYSFISNTYAHTDTHTHADMATCLLGTTGNAQLIDYRHARYAAEPLSESDKHEH